MPLEYRKIYFVLNQNTSIEGSLHIGTEDGGVLWRGEVGTSPEGYASTVMSLSEVGSLFKQKINVECQSSILERFPLIHQFNVANGLYEDNGSRLWVEDMVKESNRCHDLIDLETTIEGIIAILPTWPVYTEVVQMTIHKIIDSREYLTRLAFQRRFTLNELDVIAFDPQRDYYYSVPIAAGGLPTCIGSHGTQYTLISMKMPVQSNCFLSSFSLIASTTMGGVKVGTFYLTATAAVFSNRASATIGDVATGSTQTFSGLNILALVGDYLGVYPNSGAIKANANGGNGYYYCYLDQFGNSNVTFTLSGADDMIDLSAAGYVGFLGGTY